MRGFNRAGGQNQRLPDHERARSDISEGFQGAKGVRGRFKKDGGHDARCAHRYRGEGVQNGRRTIPG